MTTASDATGIASDAPSDLVYVNLRTVGDVLDVLQHVPRGATVDLRVGAQGSGVVALMVSMTRGDSLASATTVSVMDTYPVISLCGCRCCADDEGSAETGVDD